MRRPCRELERHIERGAEHLPDALWAHLTACARCQRAWRLHEAYRRALQAARREPTPACELPWSRVQARLAARAVRQKPARWLSPALAWGTAVVVVLAIGAALLFPTMTQSRGGTHAWATHERLVPAPADMARHEALDADAPAQAVVRAENAPRAPATTIVAQATPRRHESARLQSPAAESLSPLRAKGTMSGAARATESMPITEAYRVPHEETRALMGEATGMSPPDFGYEQVFTIASLPLTPFGVGDQATSVEYLPIRYGTSSYEGSHHEAVIGSF